MTMTTKTHTTLRLESLYGELWVDAPMRPTDRMGRTAPDFDQVVAFAVRASPALADREFRLVRVTVTETTEALCLATTKGDPDE